MTGTTGSTTFTDLALTTTSRRGRRRSCSPTPAPSRCRPPAPRTSTPTGGPAVDVTGHQRRRAVLRHRQLDEQRHRRRQPHRARAPAPSAPTRPARSPAPPGSPSTSTAAPVHVTYRRRDRQRRRRTRPRSPAAPAAPCTFSGPVDDSADAGGGIALLRQHRRQHDLQRRHQDAEHRQPTARSHDRQRRPHAELHRRRPRHHHHQRHRAPADTSGTIAVTGAGNTIATTTGTALDVSNTDIGAAGLTFQSISSNGATNGIRLDHTGRRRADGDR